MALPLILGLLGSTLGTTGALGTAIGAIGGGALGSGIGRFLETGDLEEGLKTGATSLIGGKALGAVLGGMGGSAGAEGAKTFGQAIAQDPTKTFGSTLMQAAQNPITLGQSTLAQATVPPPMPKRPDPVEFENRQAGIPRNVDRRPPSDYRPGYDGEFDYGITPNFGVGLMSPDDPRYMNDGGLVAMQEGGMAEIMAPNVEDSKELQTIIIRAARALQGATENPEKDIQVFVEKFGMQALNDLRQRVASGELSFGRDGGVRGMISGEGDGMSDSIEAEIVESTGDPSGSGRPLQVANNEYVVAADVVSDIGNGSSEAGAAKLDRLMKDVRLARHGTTEQPDEKDMMGVMKKAIS